MEMEFTSLEQLYKRLKPALVAKANEMRMQGYKYIKADDVWNYLKEVKWVRTKNLSLYEMVSDILNTDNYLIDNHLREKLNLKKRRPNLEEQDYEESY